MKDEDDAEDTNTKTTNSTSDTDADAASKKVPKSLSNHINTEGLTELEIVNIANREKDKGNEVRL